MEPTLPYSQIRIACSEGPPPTDSPEFSPLTYYYDIVIDESTVTLPELNPEHRFYQALYITGNLKITPRELTLFFKNLDFFTHGVRIHNTNLESLSFLRLFNADPLDDSPYSIEITNNSKLTSIGIDFDYCSMCLGSILIDQNPKLDLRNECDGIMARYKNNRMITNNLYDCGCTVKGNFNQFISTLSPKCWMLVGNITVDQNSDYDLLQKKLDNITRINGGISVINTNFVDLSFFRSIQTIDADSSYKASYISEILIQNNKNLTSLKFQAKQNGLSITIRDNPKLCVAPQELDALFYGEDTQRGDLDVDVCFDEQSPSYWCQVSELGYFSNISDGCVILVGHLLLDKNFDFDNSYKLFAVQTIYGSLTITNTSLRTFSIFPHFGTIRSINPSKPPLYVSHNNKLQDLYTVWRKVESDQAVIIENNTNLITSDNYKAQIYDKTPLNIDVFYGLPSYLDVSHGSNPDDSGLQNNPWDRNSTDEDYETPETSTENGDPGIFSFRVLFLLAVFKLL
ncbi:Protein CBG19450 [Caenorhabditis briggsae]|uniref:Protein CBG19450 n=1 Tax=Caenorhabditis briggsae TaxID=6238 RepID=A8XVP3_CAEBR|nr:Protein CBG19450 [Caenorhabditis briggsae]CAP36696.2 Protein CBG19450 [Caenorhabditis briggsae]